MYFEAFHHLNKHEMCKYGYYSPQKCRVFLETPVEQAAVDWAIDLNCLLLLYCSIFMHMQWLKCPSNFALTHTHTSVHRYTDTATMQRRPCSLMAMDTDTPSNQPPNHPTSYPHYFHISFEKRIMCGSLPFPILSGFFGMCNGSHYYPHFGALWPAPKWKYMQMPVGCKFFDTDTVADTVKFCLSANLCLRNRGQTYFEDTAKRPRIKDEGPGGSAIEWEPRQKIK